MVHKIWAGLRSSQHKGLGIHYKTLNHRRKEKNKSRTGGEETPLSVLGVGWIGFLSFRSRKESQPKILFCLVYEISNFIRLNAKWEGEMRPWFKVWLLESTFNSRWPISGFPHIQLAGKWIGHCNNSNRLVLISFLNFINLFFFRITIKVWIKLN